MNADERERLERAERMLHEWGNALNLVPWRLRRAAAMLLDPAEGDEAQRARTAAALSALADRLDELAQQSSGI